MTSPKYLHVCEACGVEATLTPDEAYNAGWDYPPGMGVFGVISPRTCGNCVINKTLWWKLAIAGGDVSSVLPTLTEREQATLARIQGEPASLLVR